MKNFFLIKYIKNKLNNKFIEIKTEIGKSNTKIEKEILFLANQNISLRLKMKQLLNEKINIVFVCHRPAVWGSLKTVYEAMKQVSAFDVKIVTIPNKKQLPELGLSHEIYESEGAEDFWKGEDVISGYDYEKEEWLDLKTLAPDYVFFQQPYNIDRCKEQKSWEVAKYAKICYVEYGYHTNHNLALECLPKDFIQNVSLFFLQNKTEKQWYDEYFNEFDNNFTKMFITGFPRFDCLEEYKNIDSKCWKNEHLGRFRIIWTPRWTTNEHNCNFFNYKEKFIDYCMKNESSIDFIFRPHPQAFLNWIAEGELNKEDVNKLNETFDTSKNMVIDKTKEYLTTFYSADCLVSDYSSVVPEFFLTGKPIIYCINDNAIYNIEGEITKGFYMVHNWNELEKTLSNLKDGIDPLKEIRENLIKTEFFMTEETAGKRIADIILNDATK